MEGKVSIRWIASSTRATNECNSMREPSPAQRTHKGHLQGDGQAVKLLANRLAAQRQVGGVGRRHRVAILGLRQRHAQDVQGRRLGQEGVATVGRCHRLNVLGPQSTATRECGVACRLPQPHLRRHGVEHGQARTTRRHARPWAQPKRQTFGPTQKEDPPGSRVKRP